MTTLYLWMWILLAVDTVLLMEWAVRVYPEHIWPVVRRYRVRMARWRLRRHKTQPADPEAPLAVRIGATWYL